MSDKSFHESPRKIGIFGHHPAWKEKLNVSLTPKKTPHDFPQLYYLWNNSTICTQWKCCNIAYKIVTKNYAWLNDIGKK